MSHTEFSLRTPDELRLWGQSWVPSHEIKALVCLIHGIGEHSSRYAHVAAFLNDAGYACFTFDHRGHGHSEGRRGHFPCLESVTDDMRLLLDQARIRYPGVPIILYGHSLGGNLVLNYVLRNTSEVRGVIVTAPMLRLAFKPSRIKTVLAKSLIRLLPTLSLPSGLDTRDISRDPEEVRKYDDDPIVHDRITPCFLDLIHAGEWALEHASEFPKPLLLMHGSEDHITAHENSRQFAKQAGECCTLRIWEGLYHEIHNEPERADVMGEMISWMDRILS